MKKDDLSKLKLKNKFSHRYLRTNDLQDYKTYAKVQKSIKTNIQKSYS